MVSSSCGFGGLHDGAVDAVADGVGKRDRDIDEAGVAEAGLVFADREGAGDAADVGTTLQSLCLSVELIEDPNATRQQQEPVTTVQQMARDVAAKIGA